MVQQMVSSETTVPDFEESGNSIQTNLDGVDIIIGELDPSYSYCEIQEKYIEWKKDCPFRNGGKMRGSTTLVNEKCKSCRTINNAPEWFMDAAIEKPWIVFSYS